MPPESTVAIIQVALVELGIQAGHDVLPAEEEHVMLRQPFHP